MKAILTTKQKEFIIKRKVKVGMSYPFGTDMPIFDAPNESNYCGTINVSMRSGSIFFIVKEKRNGFLRINFDERPMKQDAWVKEVDLSQRTLFEILSILLFCFIPMALYNFFKGGVEKIESKQKNS